MKKRLFGILIVVAAALALTSCDLLGSLFGFTGVTLNVSGDATHYSDETIFLDAVLEGVDEEDYPEYSFAWYVNDAWQSALAPGEASIRYKNLVVSGTVNVTIRVDVENRSGKMKSAEKILSIKASGSLRIKNEYSSPIYYVRLDGGSDLLGNASIANDNKVFVIYNVNNTHDVQLETQSGHIVNIAGVSFPYGNPQRLTLLAAGTVDGPVSDTSYWPSTYEPQSVVAPAAGLARPLQLNAALLTAR